MSVGFLPLWIFNFFHNCKSWRDKTLIWRGGWIFLFFIDIGLMKVQTLLVARAQVVKTLLVDDIKRETQLLLLGSFQTDWSRCKWYASIQSLDQIILCLSFGNLGAFERTWSLLDVGSWWADHVLSRISWCESTRGFFRPQIMSQIRSFGEPLEYTILSKCESLCPCPIKLWYVGWLILVSVRHREWSKLLYRVFLFLFLSPTLKSPWM